MSILIFKNILTFQIIINGHLSFTDSYITELFVIFLVSTNVWDLYNIFYNAGEYNTKIVLIQPQLTLSTSFIENIAFLY